MAKIEIDNKKLWESLIQLMSGGDSFMAVEDVTLALRHQGLCYKDGEITAIESEVKVKFTIPDDMDKECIELCVKLNELSHVKTLQSCCGHLKDCYMVLFECDDFIRLGKLFRCVNRNYSDGKWRIEVNGHDLEPSNQFLLTSKEPFFSYEEMNTSVKLLIDNITYWENPIFDNYFKTGESVKPDYPLIPDDCTIEPEVKWYVALNDYGHYDNTIIGAVPLFLKGERTTKENVFNMCKDIMGYEITEEEFNKNFRPATEEETTRKTLVEVYQASVDSATKEPEQPKDEIPQKTKFKVGDHIKSDVLTPRKGVVTKVNNGWYILDDRYVLNFEYEDNWELVESKPEPKKCLFTKDLYTDEDRKELCEGCQEECEINKGIEPKDELTEFEKKVRDVITSELCNNFGDVSFDISISDNEARLIAKKLLPVARKLIASEIDATQMTREMNINELISLTLGAAYYQGIVNTIKKIKGENV